MSPVHVKCKSKHYRPPCHLGQNTERHMSPGTRTLNLLLEQFYSSINMYLWGILSLRNPFVTLTCASNVPMSNGECTSASLDEKIKTFLVQNSNDYFCLVGLIQSSLWTPPSWILQHWFKIIGRLFLQCWQKFEMSPARGGTQWIELRGSAVNTTGFVLLCEVLYKNWTKIEHFECFYCEASLNEKWNAWQVV